MTAVEIGRRLRADNITAHMMLTDREGEGAVHCPDDMLARCPGIVASAIADATEEGGRA